MTTLGTYSIFLGIAYVISNTMTVTIAGEGFGALGSGHIASVPVPVFFFVGSGWSVPPLPGSPPWAATSTPLGTTTRPPSALVYRQTGYASGLFVAYCAQCWRRWHNRHVRAGRGCPQIGDPYLLSVVTAVILGGASLRGGRGTMFGTLVAVAILGVLQNGFALLQFSSFLEDTVLGCLLIFAVLTDRLVRRAER